MECPKKLDLPTQSFLPDSDQQWQTNKNAGFLNIEENCLYGLPEVNATNRFGNVELITRRGYVAAHSSFHKIPLWVAERVDTTRLAGSAIISFIGRFWDSFLVDPLITGPKATVEDYHDSRFDPGHLAPAGNILNKTATFKEMRKETYFLSNIAPMYKAFNRGVWLQLEKDVRGLAQKVGKVWVFCGPAFIPDDIPCECIGEGAVSVPTHFWKIVAWTGSSGLHVTAFLLPHVASDNPSSHFLVPLAKLEGVVKWSFFPGITSIQEKTVAEWP